MASFGDKVEALRRLRERRQARQSSEDTGDAQPVVEEPIAPEGAGAEDGPCAAQEAADRVAAALEQLAETAAAAKAADEEGAADEADALFCLGHCYEHGIHDCEQDQAKAAEHYQLAAEKGMIVAQWRLGEMYEYGRGVEADDRQAVNWYRRAAQAGHAQAQSSLALLLEDGRGVAAQDDAEALRWHLAAAEQAQALSQYCAACCLLEGRGAARDEAAAKHWLELSAAAGFPPAQEALRDRWCHAQEGDAAATAAAADTAGSHQSSLLALAARVASELTHLEDGEAEALLDELMGDINLPLVDDELLEAQVGQKAGSCAAEVTYLLSPSTAQSAPAA